VLLLGTGKGIARLLLLFIAAVSIASAGDRCDINERISKLLHPGHNRVAEGYYDPFDVKKRILFTDKGVVGYIETPEQNLRMYAGTKGLVVGDHKYLWDSLSDEQKVEAAYDQAVEDATSLWDDIKGLYRHTIEKVREYRSEDEN